MITHFFISIKCVYLYQYKSRCHPTYYVPTQNNTKHIIVL